jgi:hypothetical protein|tara:strand:+ start:7030 stop:7203 length:174 start_codon:yes stop_codon:yes gene_type:complete
METNMPRNSINTPLENNERLEFFRVENERVRENNLKLKMQIIETNEKLQKILKIINK